MGEAAAKLADFSFLTADNPRFEDVMDIARDIEKGYRRFSKEYAIISERKEAIFRALCALEKGDVLLIAGKGGEDTQEIMGIKYSYNDNAIVEEVIGKLSR
jgi:UDP-N-acetylmuramoyl-L-alanyl-D-glutamate--2,6-diaminopimelate ligase